MAVWPFLLFRVDSFPSPLLVQVGVGIAGLVAFWRPYQQPVIGTEAQQNTLAGDGTNSVLNRFSEFLAFVPVLVAFPWWIKWVYDKHLPEGHMPLVLLFLIVALLITTVHELGHTLIGLMLGMKLRALLVGPLQWCVRDGKWEFQFKLAGFLTADGAASVVPMRAGFSRWKHLLVGLGGPLINLLTGACALWIAFSQPPDSPFQAGGGMALFGAFSLGTGLMNLIPVRTRIAYSDGATIYQLLAGGPWADFHQVFAMVMSTTVNSLRPRDFDIAEIERAATEIKSGPHGLLLRLYAFLYHLDRGEIQAAAAVLKEAQSICDQSPASVFSGLESEFVFGNAYVLRDPVAAQDWWTRFETRKPRVNGDYWKAACALHWVEGNLAAANEAWRKGDTFTQNLPKAGIYEFDRHCFSLLRKALDETSAVSSTSA